MSALQGNELGDWLQSVGVVDQFTSNELQSGKTVHSLIRAILKDSRVQLILPSTAINRVTNWNNIIQELKKISIKITQEDKNKIINGSHQSIFLIISKLREYHLKQHKENQIDITEIDTKKDIKNANSMFELLILTIMRNFGMSLKESLALIASECKYLAHILAKGLKNQFKPIESLLSDCDKNINVIRNLSSNKQNQSFFLKAIKPALISKSDTVSMSCLSLLTKYLLNQKQEDRFAILKDYLVNTLLLAIKRHPHLSASIIKSIFQISNYNKQTLALISQNLGKSDTNDAFSLIWDFASKQDRIQQLKTMNNVQQFRQNCLNGLKDANLISSSLHALISISQTDIQYIIGEDEQQIIQNIGSVDIVSRPSRIVHIHQCFALLSIAGQSKHIIAPLLFKLLINLFNKCELQEENDIYLLNFKVIIKEFPSIPYAKIVEVINDKIESSTAVFSQATIELFQQTLLNPNIQLQTSLIIYNLISKILIEELQFSIPIAKMLKKIINLFKQEQIVSDMTIKLIKVCLAIHFANVKKLTQKRKSISLKSKLDPQEVQAKLKNLYLQYFISHVVNLKDENINESITSIICYSYIQIKAHKELAKGLQAIIRKLGNFDQLMDEYQKEVNQDQNTANNAKSPKVQNKNQSRYYKNESGLESNDVSQMESPNNQIDLKSSTKMKSAFPMSLSFAGVANDASKGLEKYQKRFLKKIELIQNERTKINEKQERTVRLKKVLEKKVMLKGIEIKGMQDQIEYIFQFDSQDKIVENKHNMNLTYYTTESQEDRDACALDPTMRKFQKVLRLYFSAYSGKKNGFIPRLFDEVAEASNYIHTSQTAKLLKDHGLQDYISLRQIQWITKKVNYKLSKSKDYPSESELLDYEGFKEFIIQAAYTMFTRPPKDLRGHPISQIIEELFYFFKTFSNENKFNQSLFEDPEAGYVNEGQAVKILNKKLADNPQYILPEGYKKIIDKKVTFEYGIYLQAMSLTYKEVFQTLDQILFKAFSFHLIEPFMREETIAKARPNIYFLERSKAASFDKHVSIFLRKEVSKLPIKDREYGKEAAGAIEDIIHAIQLNHDQIGIVHENPLIKMKKNREEQIQKIKLQEQKKRMNNHRVLKSAIEQYKGKKQTEKDQQKLKREESLKKKSEIQKKEKRQKELLRQKVEEYAHKKKQQQQQQKAEAKLKLQKEKQEAQKKKAQAQQIKRVIEQAKKQKEQQEKARKKKEKEEEKRKKQEEKRKFQNAQKQKKERVEEYKKSKGIANGSPKVLDSPAPQIHEEEEAQS